MCQDWKNPLALRMKLIGILFIINLVAIHGVTEENVDPEAVLAESMPKTSVKCGECPCGNPCNQQQELPPSSPPPPPPPPPPPKITNDCGPPPPRFYYFSSPLDQITQVTTPPPGGPPRFTYITGGPPENIYQTDPFDLRIDSGAMINRPAIFLVTLLLLVICGLLQILV